MEFSICCMKTLSITFQWLTSAESMITQTTLVWKVTSKRKTEKCLNSKQTSMELSLLEFPSKLIGVNLQKLRKKDILERP